MANPSNPRMDKYYLNTVPEFDGNANELAYFLKTANALITKFYNHAEPTCYDNFVLIANVRSKIKGKALNAISSYSINSWTDLKNALLTAYSDKRDCYTLAIEMANLRQTNENAFDYHNKMMCLLNAHTAYVETQIEDAYKPALTIYGQNLAVRSFLKGLQNPLRSFLQTRNPDSLNAALKIITNDFQLEANRSMSKMPQNIKSNNNNNYQNKIIRPIQIPKFTNPKPQYYKSGTNQVKPVPMSISTGQTFQRQTQMNPPNRFIQQSRPTFVSKELFNLENNETDSEDIINNDENNYNESDEQNINDDSDQNYFFREDEEQNQSK